MMDDVESYCKRRYKVNADIRMKWRSRLSIENGGEEERIQGVGAIGAEDIR
jgi:hypothetical protein